MPVSRLLRSCWSLLAIGLATGVPAVVEGQIVRGAVRVNASSVPLQSATVTARDTMGLALAAVVTDSAGRFAFRLPPRAPFDLHVRRLGYAAMTTRVKSVTASDTLEFEFLLNEVAAVADAVTITATPSLNEKRLTEAQRRGWKIYDPALVALHRERAQDFLQLLRSVGTQGVMIPRTTYDCIRSTRNNQCLTIVLDGQVMGPTALILPSDIYFLAILTASEARLQFGDRAPWGAIAVYTRSRLDRTARPDRSPAPRGR